MNEIQFFSFSNKVKSNHFNKIQNESISNERTPLHAAVKKGNAEIIQLLLANEKTNRNVKDEIHLSMFDLISI